VTFTTPADRAPIRPELVMFDLDGTLIEGFLERVECRHCVDGDYRNVLSGARHKCEYCSGRGWRLVPTPGGYDRVEWLPGRLSAVRALHDCGYKLAVCSNQTNVAFGHTTADEVAAKFARVVEELAVPVLVEICMHHAAGAPPWNCQAFTDRHKPRGGMLRSAAARAGVPLDRSLYVGDMETDRLAAEDAGVPYADGDEYFAQLTGHV
jgi:HAD superfamily hydrolase (TIGR01662 family)